MSDYAHRPGGSLKFKGGADVKKKKKKSSHSTAERSALESGISESSKAREKIEEADAAREVTERERDRDGQGRKDRREDGMAPGTGGTKLTEAERRFEETQRKRREERVAKAAKLTHKDRVQEFNSKLDQLSEHHDIPRISWTA